MNYRFGFIFSTNLGNANRYRIFRKYADRYVARMPGFQCDWAPVSQSYLPGEHDPVRFLPPPLHTRAVALAKSWPVLGHLKQFDAVMIHQLEAQPLAALRSTVRSRPVLFAAQDNPPIIDPDNYPLYPEQRARPEWRKRLRLAAELWTARNTAYHVCFSTWQADVLTQKCGIATERVQTIHTGLDLDEWPTPPATQQASSGLPRILFVGGDFHRKGGNLLLDVFRQRLLGRAELDIVTSRPVPDLPEGAHCFTGLTADSPKLRELYRHADIFALPTTADLTPWVCLEAMASAKPVVATRMGGISDLVVEGQSGHLIDIGDSAALGDRIERLIADRATCRQMGHVGREIVERDFDASKNVPRTLEFMATQVDTARSKAS